MLSKETIIAKKKFLHKNSLEKKIIRKKYPV